MSRPARPTTAAPPNRVGRARRGPQPPRVAVLLAEGGNARLEVSLPAIWLNLELRAGGPPGYKAGDGLCSN